MGRARMSLENLDPRVLLSATLKSDSLLSPVGLGINRSDADGLTVAYVPPTRMLQGAAGGFLSPARQGDPLSIAKQFLTAHAGDLSLTPLDVSQALVTDQYTDQPSGVTHIYMRETFNGLPVVGADLGIHLMSDGSVINANSSFIPGLGASQTGLVPSPQLDPITALPHAAAALGVVTGPLTLLVGSSATATIISAPSLSLDPIPAKLQYFATKNGAQLGWDFVLRLPNHDGDWYDIGVSTSDGSTLFANNWTDHIAQYNVFPIPTKAPNDGSRQLVADPSDPLASPFGWQDTNGVAGADSTITSGNNVSAQDDADANNVITPGTTVQPNGGAALNFDFPLDLTQSPSAYRSAAVTNLYYWNNIIHDIHYHYGFTEAAGNFQVNNYGRGGFDNDPVQADAQDGSGTNNANFATPPDGSSGRMQMYLWNQTSPGRDGDLDATIMVHEYGHGVSNRLTGGPANANALDAIQSGGMGEGWSDFFALMFTQKATDAFATGSFGVATYVLGQPSTGGGLRTFPYSFNKSINPHTIGDYNNSNEVHDTGEIWAETLWDMAVLLMNKYGYDSNLYTGYTAAAGAGHAGNKLALQLVMDGLKLQPANPSFSQARDAILAADRALTGGQNQSQIWQAFARRGMGFGFSDGGSSNSVTVTPSFIVPSDDPFVFQQSPAAGSQQIAPVSSMTLTFSEAVDPSSFSIANDVNFTGPGGANLNGTITGFSFSSGNTVLTINFTTTSALGAYSMTVGPNINAVDNGHAMDQDSDLTPGEASDAYVATFTFTNRIADAGFGYQAGAWPFQSTALAPGGPGVTSILTNVDDSNALIPLGSNTFRFYNTTLTSGTANAISVCENGFVSFGVVSTAFVNTDLSSPSAPRFAPLWDDWITTTDATDQVLYRFDDINGDSISDRLVIQWNNVHSATGGGTGLTFQAILQLNTGSVPGTMIANFVSIQSTNPSVTNGASATVGIKDNGAPPPNKLLVSQDTGSFPWIGDSKAIRIATDWTPPTVGNSNFTFLTGPQKLTYQFSENVGASLKSSSLTLTNTTTGLPVPPANISVSYNSGTNTATFTFPGYPAGILPDGNYTASLSGVTDALWNPLAGSSTSSFFALGGDANHDRKVDETDLGILSTNWNQSPRNFGQGDFDYNNVVNVNDLNILASHWQQTLAAPVSSPLPPAIAPVKRTAVRMVEDVLG
jgi:extracellular elastinolytic metalloproteinase